MVKIYIRMIRAGRMTLDEVPQRWRDEVASELKAK